MINNSPNSLSDLNTPQWFRISATNSTQTDYKYTFDVQSVNYNNSLGGTIGSYKLPGRPDGYCLFTPHKILKSGLTYGFIISPTIEDNQNMMVKYRLSIGEEYSTTVTFTSTQDVSGYLGLVLTSTTDIGTYRLGDVILVNKNNKSYNTEYDGTCSITATSSTYLKTDKVYSTTILADESGTIESVSRNIETSGTYSALPMIREYNQRTTNFGTSYDMRVGAQGSYLITNTYSYFTNAKEIFTNEYEMLSCYTATPSNVSYLLVTYHDVNFNTISSNTTLTGTSRNRFEVPSGTAQLVALFGTIPSTIEYYAVTIMDSDDLALSNTQYYKINRCTPSDYKRLIFLNSKGGYEYINFSKAVYTSDSFNRKQYTKVLDWNYSIGDREDTTYSVESDTITTINTDWLRDDDNNIIKGLLSSTDVYVLDGSDKYPIVINDSSVKYQTTNNFEMIQYTFTYKNAYKNNTNSL